MKKNCSNEQMNFLDTRVKGISLIEMLRIYARSTGVGASNTNELKGLKILTTAGTYTILPDDETVIFEESRRIDG